MVGQLIWCPVEACDAEPFANSGNLTVHLAEVHHTSYELATGSELTQDECDWLGLDGRDGHGIYTLGDLNEMQRASLYEFRRRRGETMSIDSATIIDSQRSLVIEQRATTRRIDRYELANRLLDADPDIVKVVFTDVGTEWLAKPSEPEAMPKQLITSEEARTLIRVTLESELGSKGDHVAGHIRRWPSGDEGIEVNPQVEYRVGRALAIAIE